MACFQMLLLSGYWYANRVTTIFTVNKQVIIHIAIVVIAVLYMWKMPFYIEVDSDAYIYPIRWQIQKLFLYVGLPFFLLASTSVLLQRWYVNISEQDNIYWLYAVSNAGSMFGILGFVVLIEPFIGIESQIILFQYIFTIIGIMLVLCAIIYNNAAKYSIINLYKSTISVIPIGTKLHWMLLSAVPSAFLIAITTYVTTDIAPIPLLWMLFLGVYLASFIMAFSGWKRLSLPLLLRLQIIFTLPILLEFLTGVYSIRDVFSIIWYSSMFFITALICHIILYRMRPEASNLAVFYLYLSVGGVLGGFFITFVVPSLFNMLFELQIIIALALMLRPSKKRIASTFRKDLKIIFVFLILILSSLFIATNLTYPFGAFLLVIIFLVTTYAVFKYCLSGYQKPFRMGLFYIVIVSSGLLFHNSSGGLVKSIRNFYGVLKIRNHDLEAIILNNGTTVHGIQYISGKKHLIPMSYYHPSGPVGDVINALQKEKYSMDIAAIGLGVGSIACYGRKEDKISFFEINPAVIDIVENSDYFSYVKECEPTVNIIAGDGRLQIKKYGKMFDLIVLDAFTSDSIPIHLLTYEAFISYKKHLKKDGVILINISNRYLNLGKVVSAIANNLGMDAMVFFDKDISQDKYKNTSIWVVMAKKSVIKQMNLPKHWGKLDSMDSVYLWTDDYSNILRLMF
ncbi:MAG: fused MFS/spermidine synthase [Rickettsiales bacterium]